MTMPKPAEDAKTDTDLALPVRDRPVPRISIGAFCESPETGAVLQRAAAYRRLAKTHVSVHMGGIQSAAEHYSESATPNLVIVETRDHLDDIPKRLEALAGVCDPATKVIVIGPSNDVALYRDLIRQGVSDYLVAPIHPMQVIEAIAGLYTGGSAKPIGRVFAFIAAKGGSGSSTIAHNVAWSLAEELGVSTTLADFDLPYGTAGLDFNQDPAQGVADALMAPERLDDVLLDRLLVKCTPALNLLAAPAVLDRDYDLDAQAFETVIDILRQTAPAAVCDMPHAWMPWSRQTLLAADEIVIVATPDLASLRNAKSLFDIFSQLRPHDAKPRLVLNQVGVPKRPEIPVKDFAEAIGQEPLLVLPFDPQLFGAAANNGQMIVQLNPQARAAQGFQHLARVLTGRTSGAEAKPKSASPVLRFLNGLKTAKKAG
jgi:pilus assembly protein CpaE